MARCFGEVTPCFNETNATHYQEYLRTQRVSNNAQRAIRIIFSIRLEPFNERDKRYFVVERGRLGDHVDRSSLLGYWTANQTASFCVFYFMTDSRDYGLADTSRARLSSRLL